MKKTLDNFWSRAVLLNFIVTDLYERQGKAVSNFALTLPEEQSDLAQAITRDPYNFDFLTIREKFDKKELKDALMDNIGKFLLELGNGFAFVGREVRLQIGETEEYVDMLFYNIKLHCYVVVEVKVEEFNPRDIGEFVRKDKQGDDKPYPVFNGGTGNTGYYDDYNHDGEYILISARGANAGYANIIVGTHLLVFCGGLS